MPDFAWEKAKTNSYTKFFLIFSARNEKQKKQGLPIAVQEAQNVLNIFLKK